MTFRGTSKQTAGKVEEFKFLAQTAQKHGLKIWLFGGSASSLAHYVKENMLLEEGSDEYYSQSFAETPDGKRDFTDIFRPTQDIDLVVDGEMEQIKNFEREVLQHLPDIKGNKQTWEVRTLREDYGEKLALLNNPNFFNQHTDSHSVGMISLSEVPEGKVVRDLLDWESDNPRFLQDVLANKLHYYYSAHHSETLRFKEGKNPPIISVVRYFIKLFQHELEMSDEDLKKLQKIIMGFNPQEVGDSYTERWLQHNAPKLFLHSRNVEYSWDMLEQTGLRAKLLQVGDINKAKSPAWWANKSPLRSFKLGQGEGKTAQELGIKTVAHDTSDFFLWTVITRSRKGEANVFESRPDAVGEAAAYGRGFYTIKNSKQGLYKNGFSIGFHMHPKAREGVDFKVKGSMVLVFNRNAIRVIPESLDVGGLLDYLHLLKEGERGNLALLEKVRRRIDSKHAREKETPEIQREITQVLEFLKEEDKLDLWRGWFNLKLSRKYPKILDELINTAKSHVLQFAAQELLSQPYWDNPELVDKTIAAAIKAADCKLLEALALYTFSQPHTKGMTASIDKIIAAAIQFEDSDILRSLAIYTFSKPHAKGMTASIDKIIAAAIQFEDSDILRSLAIYTFSKPHAKGMADLIEKTIDAAIKLRNLNTLSSLAIYTFSQPHTKEMAHLIDKTIDAAIQFEESEILEALARHTFSKPHTKEMAALIEKIIDAAIQFEDYEIFRLLVVDTFSHPHTKGMTDLIEKTINAAIKLNQLEILQALAANTFSKPHTKEMAHLIDKTIDAAIQFKNRQILRSLAKHTFSQPHTKEMTNLIDKTITAAIELQDPSILGWLVASTFSRSHSKEMAHLIDKTIDAAIQLENPNILSSLANKTFPRPHTQGMTDLIDKTIAAAIQLDAPKILQSFAWYTFSKPHTKGMAASIHKAIVAAIQLEDLETLKRFARHSLSRPHWQDHPELLELLIQNGDRETLQAVRKHVLTQPHWENHPRLLELSRGKVTLRKLMKGLNNEAQGC